LAAREVIECRAQGRPGVLQVANVMHADIPGITGAMKTVGVTAGRVVALQPQDFLRRVLESSAAVARPPIPEPMTIASQRSSSGCCL
jgi:hypothetical protein